MTNMEDQGIAAAITLLTKMGKADFQRVLFLRTGSNYCTPAPQQGVVQSMQAEYAGWVPSVESAYRVGSVVVHDIVAQWDAVYAEGREADAGGVSVDPRRSTVESVVRNGLVSGLDALRKSPMGTSGSAL